jgi:uncharacterized protein (TIGR03083 family)
VQLHPRYDGSPVIQLEGPVGDPAAPLLRQRRRLADVLAGLDATQWNAPSRCDAWSVKDVVAHLVTVNQYWAFSIAAGRAGQPTRVLATFDPVASPAQLVEATRDVPVADTLAQFIESNDALAASLDGVDDDGWAAIAEAPPGHVTLHTLSLHALWDAWIHERDIALPLGLLPAVEADEVGGALRYAAAIGPALLATNGSSRSGAIAVAATDPDIAFVVEAGADVVVRDGAPPDGALHLSGSATDLVDALSCRAPLNQPVAAEQQWLLSGLAEVFEQISD